MNFLKADWENLILINYEIDPNILSSYLPNGTLLDFHEDKCYISLVGFLFKNTKLLGLKIPFHVNFEEVNLRFYVKRKEGDNWKRGVVFIKEFVPKWALSFVANKVYKEHYETVHMNHQIIELPNELKVNYNWKMKNQWNDIQVIAEKDSNSVKSGSIAEFITEHYWGYAKVNDRQTNEYEVTHPKWVHHNLKSYNINVNFENNYGKEFAFLTSLKPNSVILAKGSEITVKKRKKLTDKYF